LIIIALAELQQPAFSNQPVQDKDDVFLRNEPGAASSDISDNVSSPTRAAGTSGLPDEQENEPFSLFAGFCYKTRNNFDQWN
jgi:hypothetical protein